MSDSDEPQSQPQQAYSYPNLGPHAVTIYAASQAEADEKAAKLRADMASAASL
jgi:hypothetical protein